MLPSRKSRLDERPSLLPKPRRPYSIERQSTENRCAGTTGRSSSAEPPRSTIGVVRLSREASATKLRKNARSRSQQGDRYMTPLRSSQYPGAMMTTPRTPAGDHSCRTWQSCLEKALAFVTVRDERPLSNPAWQRAEFTRVTEGLAALEARNSFNGGAARTSAGVGEMTLVRPLTIARFVDIINALVNMLISDPKQLKLTADNYVVKLPHILKRILYPATISKSTLKTVNTLHSFPHALAIIAYMLDLVNHIESPASPELLYRGKEEATILRHEYVYKCWARFQSPLEDDYRELDEEYLNKLKALLGCDDKKFQELKKKVNDLKESIQDQEELAAQADEARRVEENESLAAELKEVRAERHRRRADTVATETRNAELEDQIRNLDADIERASAERSRLQSEVEAQPMTVAERTRLLDDIDYSTRVRDSKEALAKQVAKMVQNKETELALWQKKTLDSCVEYKQGLIQLLGQFPDLASLSIDEKELMEPECAARVHSAVEKLRELSARLAEQRAQHARNKTNLARKRAALLEQVRAKIAVIKSSVEREQQALDSEMVKEKAEVSAWNVELQGINSRLEELRSKQDEYLKIDRDLEYWEAKGSKMRENLTHLQEYVVSQREKSARMLDVAKQEMAQRVLNMVAELNNAL